MRISDRYIGRQVLFGTLAAVAVLSLVLVLGRLFKDIRPLLVDKQAPLWLVLRFMFDALVAMLMFSVPWGFLSSVLLVFGRMSSAQEITGFRVAGVSLPRLVAPVFVLAAAFSGLCLWLNVSVVPKAKAPLRALVFEQAKRDPRSLLSPGITNAEFRGVKFYIEDQRDDSMIGMHLYRIDPATESRPEVPPAVSLHASRFTYVVDEANKQLRLKLYDADFRNTDADGTFQILSASDAEPYLMKFSEFFHKSAKAGEMTNPEIATYLAAHPELTAEQRARYRLEVVQRYSLSMACLAFAFVGVPLALQSRRKESSAGLLLSLVLAGAYFLFSILADGIKDAQQATAALWAPNVLCVLIGLWLFARAKYK